MLRRIALIVAALVVAIVVGLLTSWNPGTVQLNLGFGTVEASISLAFVVAFACGWVFGVISMGLYAFKLIRERRGLRKNLRNTESEVASLRSLPVSDAE